MIGHCSPRRVTFSIHDGLQAAEVMQGGKHVQIWA